ncbi:hypothetical protein PN36_19370 [Candidatus Thiomargarita nelsonii]|uniref:Uncharacterized protein n=1 Tax=Candidatus Thiomargarita nelsonii TaxID=1003181 RepID=A0A0A6PN58_9GAMM|nr:hypothetical protein PN36_19370 [Candidatus Thiomargarita nelsonii]
MTHNDEPLIDTKTDLPKDDDHFIIQPSTYDDHDLKKPTVYAGLGAARIPPDKQENLTVETTQPEPADEATNQQPDRIDEPQADDKMEFKPEKEDDDEGTLFVGEATIKELMKKGNDIFLVVGVAGSGKTQLLEAFDRHIQRGAISVFKSSPDGRVKGTSPNTLNILSLNSNAIFIDASGENFSALYPGDDKSITQKDLKIPKLVKPKLRGLILVIELEAYWTDEADSKKMQIKILTWILVIFRWLFNGGVYPEDTNMSLEQYINHSVKNLKGAKTRLDIPVQVLFSKADRLHGFPVHGSKEQLFPKKDSPFFLAYHYLPEIHHALLKHTNYFRYDFAHSIVTDSKTEPEVLENEPCGVELSFQWLLNHPGKGSPRTEDLIEQQKRIDKRRFWRPSRWKQKSIVKA